MLSDSGISNELLHLLQSMYGNASSALLLNGRISPVFPCKRGVRQGRNLSPLLFCLYVADLEQTLRNEQSDVVTLVHTRLTLLMFADDLVLLADSHTGLQRCHVAPTLSRSRAMATKRKTRHYYSTRNFPSTVSFGMQASVNDSDHGRAVRIFVCLS